MRRIPLPALALCASLVPAVAGPALADDPLPAELVARTEARSAEDERAGFHLPPGFEIQLVASDPDIHKPMNIAFDDRGRLWVTETVEYPFPAKDGATPRDGVKILEDFAPDGLARKITTFASGLNIPIGLLPMPGGNSALVHSIPTIDRFTDTDGDGKADRREVAYSTYGSRDTHGMTNAFTWGLDGWIYACHGFNNESEIQGNDGKPFVLQSGNTYRMKPDGSHAEAFTHGQVNPFGLCFDTLGNLYSADCHSKPVYQLLRGAYYPSFGKPSDGLGFGPEMVQHDHGSTAISGVVSYAADAFPPEYRDTIFIGNVVTNRLNHDTIEWRGSTAKGILQPDFLTSDDPWFRPVDLKLGPDGFLYVADFYNKIIGHYEVPLTHPGRDRERGRIWRIIYRGEDSKVATNPLPDFTKFGVADLFDTLAGPNFAARITATNALVARGGSEVLDRARRMISDGATPPAKVHALWIAERMGGLDESLLVAALRGGEPTLRLQARRVVAQRPNPDADLIEIVREGLKDEDAFVRRASADCLGRHPDEANVRPLLDARHAAPAADEAIVHVVRMALRDQFLTAATWPKLDAPGFQEADYRALADVALGAPTAGSAAFLVGFLSRYDLEGTSLKDSVHHAARYGDPETSALLLSFAHSYEPESLSLQGELVKSIHGGLQERGEAFAGPIREWALDVTTKLVEGDRPELVAQGIELTESLHLGENRDALGAIARTSDRPESLRISAANAIAAIDPATSAEPLGSLLADPSVPTGVREAAANALAKTNQDNARARLIEALPTASERLQTAIAAALAATRPGAEALIAAVSSGKASARLLGERSVRVWLDQSGVPDLASSLDRLTAGLPPADSGLADMLDRRRSGFVSANADPIRGLEVFRKNCAACHQIGGEGARIGPQLDGIGVRGAERLVEDILDPNRNVDQAFRLSTVALTDGRVVAGLELREEGDVLILADAQGKEVRVAKGDIDERKVAAVSPMPADFAEKVPAADFFDLLAFLLARTSK